MNTKAAVSGVLVALSVAFSAQAADVDVATYRDYIKTQKEDVKTRVEGATGETLEIIEGQAFTDSGCGMIKSIMDEDLAEEVDQLNARNRDNEANGKVVFLPPIDGENFCVFGADYALRIK